jgi:hypothetical protein
LQRKDGNNIVAKLSPEELKKVWTNPLLRYSKILDGLFHDGVIVCEGDADCMFYQSMLEISVSSEMRSDLLFTYGAGKSRIATIVRALHAIRVPVRVVTDFDVLSDDKELVDIVESLGGTWAEFKDDWKIVKNAVEKNVLEITRSEARKEIIAIIDQSAAKTLTDLEKDGIKKIVNKGSLWKEAKRVGKAIIPSGNETRAYGRLASALKLLGVFIVEVGEMEGFCRAEGAHGPSWVAEVLKRKLDSDQDLEEARKFAAELGVGWPSQGKSE